MSVTDDQGVAPPDHPLITTLDRVAQASGGYLKARLGPGSGEGWFSAAELLNRPVLIEDFLERIARDLGTTDQRAPASFFFKTWCNLPLMLGLGCSLLEQPIPDLSVDNVLLRVSEIGYVEEVALVSGSFTTLLSNAASGHVDARVVPDRMALHEHLFHTVISEYFAPVIRSLQPMLPFGERFMWATVADTCAGLLTIIAKRLNEPELCRAEAERWVSRTPLKGKTGIVTVEWDGHSEIFLRRGCCCFAYKLEQFGHCKTCPLLSPDDRLQLLQAEIQRQIGQ